MKYIDLHCDYLSFFTARARFARAVLQRKSAKNVLFDYAAADCAAQCFALFCKGETSADAAEIQNQLALFKKISPFLQKRGVRAVLTVEGGGATRGDLQALDRLFSAGVRMFSPVWNINNALCAACGQAEGLTDRGKKAAEFAAERGVVLDISHASDAASERMIFLSRRGGAPAVASHALCRALCDRARNLSDRQIRLIAESGGVVGVCFVRDFAGRYPLTRHIAHIVNVGGEDCVSLGGDLFGCDRPLVDGVRGTPRFLRSLEGYFSPRLIEKIASKNAKERLPSLFRSF